MRGPKSVPDWPLLFCVFIIFSTVKDGNFRLWRNALQLGRGLDGDGLDESRRDGAQLLNHRDNGGGLGHADNSARLAGIGDNVASMETERIIHGRFFVSEQSRLRCLGCKPWQSPQPPPRRSGFLKDSKVARASVSRRANWSRPLTRMNSQRLPFASLNPCWQTSL